MQEYNNTHAPYMSFYSAPFYQDVARNWHGLGFFYLFLLVIITWLPDIYALQKWVSETANVEAPGIVEQLPRIEISDGRVHVDVKTPYYIYNPKDESLLIAIDTSGQLRSLRDTDARLLLTDRELFIDSDDGNDRLLSLDEIGANFVVDQDLIFQILGWLDSWFAIVAFPFVVAFSYAFRIIQVLVYALIALLLAALLKTQLKYTVAIRLAVMAITPVLILDMLRSIFDITVPHPWVVAFLIAMAYLFFAVYVNSQPEAGAGEAQSAAP